MPSGPVRDEAVKEAKHEDETIGTLHGLLVLLWAKARVKAEDW